MRDIGLAALVGVSIAFAVGSLVYSRTEGDLKELRAVLPREERIPIPPIQQIKVREKLAMFENLYDLPARHLHMLLLSERPCEVGLITCEGLMIARQSRSLTRCSTLAAMSHLDGRLRTQNCS
jgi:hypothetical protein